MSDGIILIHGDDNTAASPASQPPSNSTSAAVAACCTAVSTPTGPEAIARSSSEESLDREEAATVLKHGFWGLIVIGAVTGLSAGFLTGATGV